VITYSRSWALDDIEISRADGGGRTVEAYAAVFDTPAEIKDQHGHYMEVIDRAAFNRTLSHGIARVAVYYNHAMNAYGQPSDVYSVPIGRAVDIVPDGRGLRTVTRFNDGPDAERILDAIRNNAITGYSFRGRIFRSNPERVPRARGGDLPTVTRHELGLAEYGPTPSPAYGTAAILAVRSTDRLAADLAALDEEQRAELIRMLASATPIEDSADDTATPAPGPGAEDSHTNPVVHSGRQSDVARRARVGRLLRGM
jgi:HK97 family phage prohead protease